jgi:DNA-directed RNA polymerase specialized sigma24 family protein
MDKVLVPYLTADDEREREQHLDELLTRHAAPLIRQVLRRKFGFYVSGQGVNKNNQDAEDLYQEAITRVVQVLNQLHASSNSRDIENFKRMYHALLQPFVSTSFVTNRQHAHG